MKNIRNKVLPGLVKKSPISYAKKPAAPKLIFGGLKQHTKKKWQG
jgi:hypothetical protein